MPTKKPKQLGRSRRPPPSKLRHRKKAARQRSKAEPRSYFKPAIPLRPFTFWGHKDYPHTGTGGEGPPPPDPTLPELHLIWRIEATTWEEAMAIYHLRHGWHPYRPSGDPAPCPECGETYYPEGSAQCWHCGFGTLC